ncbi:MAG: glycosyltransferase N-terminal domain-containing protein, partial [Armatimonadota bacterium]|nr:glycosyltransferase N-terminal domain-containing protein [Armatimonadota bacterium]
MKQDRWWGVRLLYNLTLLAAVPLLLFYLLYRVLRGKSREGWTDRMGWLPETAGEPVVWVHAVSAGEAVAAEAVLRRLRVEDPLAVETRGLELEWLLRKGCLAEAAPMAAQNRTPITNPNFMISFMSYHSPTADTLTYLKNLSDRGD